MNSHVLNRKVTSLSKVKLTDLSKLPWLPELASRAFSFLQMAIGLVTPHCVSIGFLLSIAAYISGKEGLCLCGPPVSAISAMFCQSNM